MSSSNFHGVCCVGVRKTVGDVDGAEDHWGKEGLGTTSRANPVLVVMIPSLV